MEEQLIDDLLDATDALLADDAPGWQAGEEDDSVTPRLDKQLLPLVRSRPMSCSSSPASWPR